MCGLAGIISKNQLTGAAEKLARLSDALFHRGPDGSGTFIDDHVAIIHRRLSIVDLEGGAQPITSTAGNVIAVNGEIYNDIEIRKQHCDAKYLTGSDSETPLVLYEKYGEAFVDHLRGMYALALYDKSQHMLILARDPYGIKPLYYSVTDDQVLFSSEPQALFQADLLDPEVEPSKAVELLQLKFTTAQQTIFKNVERVLPGEMLVIQQGKIIRRNRKKSFVSKHLNKDRLKNVKRTLDAEFQNSVKAHVRSDVPYGVFLSGGVDSCSIVAAMAECGLQDFPCYTAFFPDSSLHPEIMVARAVTTKVGAEHIEVPVVEADFWATLPKVIACVDDPSLDPAMVANYLLAERATKDVKVVLCGDGGDEVFAGYRRYERAILPSFLGRKEARTKGQFDGTDLTLFSAQNWREGFAASAHQARENTQTFLQSMQATDAADFLPHFNLMKLDRCLMAHGIEGRTPFLDQTLSPFGFNLPDRHKLKNFRGKWIMRNWLREKLPEAEPFSRKRGFSVPVGQWIAKRASEFAGFVCEQPGVCELFDINKIRLLFTDDDHPQLKLRWSVFYYALWHQHHIARQTSPLI